MTKKSLIILLFNFLLIISPVYSQVKISLDGGLNFSNISILAPQETGFDYRTKSESGISSLFSIDLPLTNNLYFNPGVRFINQKYSVFNSPTSKNISGVPFDYKNSLTSIQLPLSLKCFIFNNDISPYFIIGPNVSYTLAAKKNLNGSNSDIISSMTKIRMCIDAGLGIDYKINSDFSMNGKAIYSTSPTNLYNYEIYNENISSYNILIGISYNLYDSRIDEKSPSEIKPYDFSSFTITPFFESVSAIQKNNDIKNASGMGAGLELKFPIDKNFSISLSSSYSVIDIDQNNAVSKWNWIYWDKRFASRVSVLRLDTNYKIDIRIRQFIDILPTIISLNYSEEIINGLILNLNYGIGVFLFERNLYQVEHWKRKFPSIDYQFEYEYRDYADEKRGDLLGMVCGIGINYQIYDWIDIYLKSKYSYIPVGQDNRNGYNSFPFVDLLSFNIGFSIHY